MKEQNNGHQGFRTIFRRPGIERMFGEGSLRHRWLIPAVFLIVALVVGATAWASITGRLAALPYTNIPIVHPFPPSGYFVNPFTGDPRDLVNSAEATKVRSDLLRDGQVELDALMHGDAQALPQTATGPYLIKLTESVAADNERNVIYKEQHQLSELKVGRLVDPNDSSVTWCVEESGSGHASYLQKETGQQISDYDFQFSGDRFWLVLHDGHYLITDAYIPVIQGQSR